MVVRTLIKIIADREPDRVFSVVGGTIIESIAQRLGIFHRRFVPS